MVKNALGGAVGAILAAAGVAFFSWLFADPIGLFGGVHESDFAPYQACAQLRKLYLPGHNAADEKGCVVYPASTVNIVLKSKTKKVVTTSYSDDFDFDRDTLLIVSANVTGERGGADGLSFVWTEIKVDNTVCSSDEATVTAPARKGYSIHASATCIITLTPGEHEISVERIERNVVEAQTRLLVRYVVLSQ